MSLQSFAPMNMKILPVGTRNKCTKYDIYMYKFLINNDYVVSCKKKMLNTGNDCGLTLLRIL